MLRNLVVFQLLNPLKMLESNLHLIIFLYNLLIFDSIFAEKNFAHYEVAQLVNLCCDTAEEAKTLIPRYILLVVLYLIFINYYDVSLKKKMNDPELEGLLTSMLTYKKYQG